MIKSISSNLTKILSKEDLDKIMEKMDNVFETLKGYKKNYPKLQNMSYHIDIELVERGDNEDGFISIISR